MALLLLRRELANATVKAEALTEPDSAPESSCLAYRVSLAAPSPIFIRLLNGLAITLSLRLELCLQFPIALQQASNRWITSQSRSGKRSSSWSWSWGWSSGCGGGGRGIDTLVSSLPELPEFEFEFGDEAGDVGRVFGPGLQVL